jgi:hypothetical protein
MHAMTHASIVEVANKSRLCTQILGVLVLKNTGTMVLALASTTRISPRFRQRHRPHPATQHIMPAILVYIASKLRHQQ